jgi:hypothetical protein
MEVIYKHKRAELPELAPQFAIYEPIMRKLAGQGSGGPLPIGPRVAGCHFGFEDAGMSAVVARAAGSGMPLLRVPTPADWVAQACANPDVLLIDHANCEKKAASTALSLMFAYAEDLRADRQDVAAGARGAASLRAGGQAHPR